MDEPLSMIPIERLLVGFVPTLLLLALLYRWSLGARTALYANARMLLQLLAVGYVLRAVFETDEPIVIVLVVVVMIGASSWIALRPIANQRRVHLPAVVFSIALCGGVMLAIVTQLVLDVPRWFEPHVVVPLAGMIFANAMNAVSLAAERFESEQRAGAELVLARGAALETALIPQINGLLAVGLVSLPGMMTGQILSGVDPLVAVRYQIMVMSMVFGSGGLAAACYLQLRVRAA